MKVIHFFDNKRSKISPSILIQKRHCRNIDLCYSSITVSCSISKMHVNQFYPINSTDVSFHNEKQIVCNMSKY